MYFEVVRKIIRGTLTINVKTVCILGPDSRGKLRLTVHAIIDFAKINNYFNTFKQNCHIPHVLEWC